MASFKANLDIDGATYRVLSCSYGFDREIDQFGKPSADVQGGRIELEIESSGTDFFAAWATSPRLRKGGKVVFEDPAEDAELKVLEFEDAYCISYLETFTSGGNSGMTESFRLSAKKIKVGEAELENRWAK